MYCDENLNPDIETSTPFPGPPTPECGSIGMPDFEEISTCIPQEKLDQMVGLLDGVITGLPEGMLENMDFESLDMSDLSWLCGVQVGGVPIIDMLNSCALDEVIDAFNAMLLEIGTPERMTNSINNLLDVVLNETIVQLINEKLYEAVSLLSPEELVCVGQWTSDAALFAKCLIGDGSIITSALYMFLYASYPKEELAEVIQGFVSGFAPDFTIEDAMETLDIFEQEIVDVAKALIEAVFEPELRLIAYFRTAVERGMPTQAEVADAVNDLLSRIKFKIVPAISQLVYDILEQFPLEFKEGLNTFTTTSTIRFMIATFLTGVDCFETECIPE